MPRKPSCTCGRCKKCKNRIAQREWYQRQSAEKRREIVERRDKEKVRARDRERSKKPERIARISANTKRWREQNPEKARAHSKVQYALRKGTLAKAERCERPDCKETQRLHAHHDDYSKPLDVRWLCPLHHAQEQ